jgi:hypothetical protein
MWDISIGWRCWWNQHRCPFLTLQLLPIFIAKGWLLLIRQPYLVMFEALPLVVASFCVCLVVRRQSDQWWVWAWDGWGG